MLPVAKPAGRGAGPFAGAYQQGARVWVDPAVGVARVTDVACVVDVARVPAAARGAGAFLREARRVVGVCVWVDLTPGAGT
jgi:hypothetical protein